MALPGALYIPSCTAPSTGRAGSSSIPKDAGSCILGAQAAAPRAGAGTAHHREGPGCQKPREAPQGRPEAGTGGTEQGEGRPDIAGTGLGEHPGSGGTRMGWIPAERAGGAGPRSCHGRALPGPEPRALQAAGHRPGHGVKADRAFRSQA